MGDYQKHFYANPFAFTDVATVQCNKFHNLIMQFYDLINCETVWNI